MRKTTILFTILLLSTIAYAGKEKKATKQQQPKLAQQEQPALQKDTIAKGVDNSIDFGGRIYDPRLRRSMHVEPPQQQQGNPYQYSTNHPVKLDK